MANNRKDKLLLANFGRAPDDKTTKDVDARDKYRKTSEVYAFGLCTHYLIWG